MKTYRKLITTTAILLTVLVVFSYLQPKTIPSSREVVVGGLDVNGPVSPYIIKDSKVYYVSTDDYSSTKSETEIDADPGTTDVIRGDLTNIKSYISYRYIKDTSSVFYDGKKLEVVNVATFYPISNGGGRHWYGSDGVRVYFKSEIIPDAATSTFKILWQTTWEGCGLTSYSTDDTHVYYGAQLVSEADPATFEALIEGYGKDKRGYYKYEKFMGPNIDPKLLECTYG